MVNKVILMGNLGADPEVRSLESGHTVVNARLATNESYKDKTGEWQQLTEWHYLELWNQYGQAFAEKLKKGDAVLSL